MNNNENIVETDRNNNQDIVEADKNDANRDPISNEPGAHPVGTGVGAAGAGTAATLIGAVVGGPVGGVVGAVVGSVIGGLAGKVTAESVNPTFEDTYWRETYTTRSYVDPNLQYEDYQTAYRIGYEGYDRSTDQNFHQAEPQLKREYETHCTQQGRAGLPWETAKHAVKDAWDKAHADVKH
jgi:uncharacterized protein YcfJ